MPIKTLTEFFIKSATCPADKIREEYFDTEVSALALRVSAQGTKSFVLYYRIGKKQRCMTLSKYPHYSLKKAREEAREMQVAISKGGDPLSRRQDDKYKAYIDLTKELNTYERMVDKYVDEHLKPKGRRTWKQIKNLLKSYPITQKQSWEKWEVEKITKAHVRELIDEVYAAGARPIAANRLLANLKRFFGWLCELDIIEASPAHYIKKPGDEVRRDRWLSRDEIKTFWKVCEAEQYPWKQRYQLALITGMRGQEIMRMRWVDVDLKEKIWTIPASDSKNGRQHAVPLSDMAIDVISSIPKISDVYLFSTVQDKSITHNNKRVQKLYDACGFDKPWTLHDLRRTVATFLGELGHSKDVISRVLNHSQGVSVTDTYLRHQYMQEKARALNSWGIELDLIISGSEQKVVHLHRH
ncbi:MAG: tyrosine-type recombinase/integrase [Alphaproteobacteria bacterium]